MSRADSQFEPILEYAGSRPGRPPGAGSAVASFCLGSLVAIEATWALIAMSSLDPHGNPEDWAIVGLLLSVGAIAAAIGLVCALYGRATKARPNRLRMVGGIMCAAYLVGYAVLLAVAANWA
jgi:hypothetical protein